MEIKITDKWNGYLTYFEKSMYDTYFTEEYVKQYNSDTDKAVCYICNEGDNYLIFPFLKRDFENNGNTYHDFETPYGYGGPIANTTDSEFINQGLEMFYDYCKSNKYVAGFVRFHPLLKNSDFYHIGRVLLDRETVAINLMLSEDEIWMKEFNSKNRSRIKQAINKSKLKFVTDTDFEYLDDFIDLYNKTMNKVSADDFFNFDRKYYEDFINNVENKFLGVVLYGDRVISAAIFFYSQDYGHYHLSGSDAEYLNLNPNNFMIWEAAKVLKSYNVKMLHLGGGSNSDPENSLLEFKSKFSAQRQQFNIGKTIFDNDMYRKLCTQWDANSNIDKKIQFKNHLLKYKY